MNAEICIKKGTGWQHQAIIWTNVDLKILRSSGIDLRAISWEMPQPSITEISLGIAKLKFESNFPGANQLTKIFNTIQCPS